MEEKKKAELKDRLAEALDAAGLRPVELAERTGIPKSMLSYYLNGKTKPKADRVYIIAKELDVNEAWLLGFNVPRYRTDEQKKNDHLAEMIVLMRENNDFYKLALKLSKMDAEQLDLIDKLVSGLTK